MSVNLNDLRNSEPVKSTAGDWKLKELLEKDIQLFPSRFTDKDKESFYLELSTLLVAGLDIKSALELIEDEQAKRKNKELIKNIKDNVINGDSLWEAMQKEKEFTPYEYFSVQIGE